MYWSRHDEDGRRKRILCSAVEHHAVQDTVEWLERHEGAEAVWLPVDSQGVVRLDAVRAEIERDPGSVALVTVMWANNEVGSIQPVKEIAEIAAAHGIPVHSDAVQAFGSIPLGFRESGLAAMSVSSHKIGGPVGVGALFLGRSTKVTPVQHGEGRSATSARERWTRRRSRHSPPQRSRRPKTSWQSASGSAPCVTGSSTGSGPRFPKQCCAARRRRPAARQRPLHVPGL